jgi:hypothetical protein
MFHFQDLSLGTIPHCQEFNHIFKHSFKPGLVQGSGFGFWSGHRVVRVNFFLKSKRRRFSKKNKNRLQPGLAGSPRVFPYLIFFQHSSIPAPSSRSTHWARPDFKTMLSSVYKYLKKYIIYHTIKGTLKLVSHYMVPNHIPSFILPPREGKKNFVNILCWYLYSITWRI